MYCAVEQSAQTGVPLLSVNASGGARMHEGLFSLMQMAKTVAAFSRLGEARVPRPGMPKRLVNSVGWKR